MKFLAGPLITIMKDMLAVAAPTSTFATDGAVWLAELRTAYAEVITSLSGKKKASPVTAPAK